MLNKHDTMDRHIANRLQASRLPPANAASLSSILRTTVAWDDDSEKSSDGAGDKAARALVCQCTDR